MVQRVSNLGSERERAFQALCYVQGNFFDCIMESQIFWCVAEMQVGVRVLFQTALVLCPEGVWWKTIAVTENE